MRAQTTLSIQHEGCTVHWDCCCSPAGLGFSLPQPGWEVGWGRSWCLGAAPVVASCPVPGAALEVGLKRSYF